MKGTLTLLDCLIFCIAFDVQRKMDRIRKASRDILFMFYYRHHK